MHLLAGKDQSAQRQIRDGPLRFDESGEIVLLHTNTEKHAREVCRQVTYIVTGVIEASLRQEPSTMECRFKEYAKHDVKAEARSECGVHCLASGLQLQVELGLRMVLSSAGQKNNNCLRYAWKCLEMAQPRQSENLSEFV